MSRQRRSRVRMPLPRASRRGAAKLVLAVIAAIAVSAAVVVVAWNIDGPSPSARSRGAPAGPGGEIAPSPLTGEERAGRLDRLDETSVALAEGGWVQVADAEGRLAQEYSASRMDPQPQRWVQMQQPRARIFASDGRLITLASRTGRVRIPDRAIESGTLSGEVVIEIHRAAAAGGRVPADAVPELVIRAEEATFDQLEGRIRCDRRIELEAPGVFFEGEGLLLLLDESGRGFERLRVERATGPIRLQPALFGGSGTDAAAASPSGEPAASTPSATPSATPAAGEPGAVQAPDPASTPADESGSGSFHRLILEDEVVVVRTAGSERTVLSGDRLEAVFSMEDRSFGGFAAATPPPPAAWLAATLLGASQPIEGDEIGTPSAPRPPERIEISFAGLLELLPLEAGEERPQSPGEVLLRMSGREVLIEDERQSATVRCERLVYLSRSERLLLEAPASRVQVEAPEFTLAAPSLAADLLVGEVLLPGRGTLEVVQAGGVEAASDGEPLRVSWEESLELLLRSGRSGVRSASFEGAVAVSMEELALASDRLEVSFQESRGENGEASGAIGEAASRDRLESIEATGRARAQRRGEMAGRLDAERILIEFAEPTDGAGRGDRPRRMLAEGGVRAIDEAACLWAERVEVELAESAGAAGDEPAASPRELAIRRLVVDSPGGGGAVVGLADGAWIHAARIDARREEAEGGSRVRFEGPELAILRDGAILDRLAWLELIEQEEVRLARSARGRLRAIEGSLVAFEWPQLPSLGDGLRVAAWEWPPPAAKPDPLEDLSLHAVWSDSMEFSERVVESERISAAGEDATLQLRGAVQVRAWPAKEGRLQEDRLEAGEVEVQFRRGEASADAGAGLDRAGLEPVRLLARQEASLETRSAAAEATLPSLFRIAGPEIEYRLADGEGWVRGAGSLLVSEPAVGARPAQTSRFRWLGRLELLRPQPQRAVVNLVDGVELMHADGAAAFSMTSQRMEITLATSPSESPRDGAAGELLARDDARLLRVQGLGRVFIRSAERDLECDRFDYDAESGVAVASARQGRSVTVVNRGSAGPLRAEQARWNLRSGEIELVKVGGALSP